MDYGGILSVPTDFRGVAFRSRLEARWAVFLDSLGIEWAYEPVKFDLPSGVYAPDFHVRPWYAYLEVKSEAYAGDLKRQLELVYETDAPVLVCVGRPYPGRYKVLYLGPTGRLGWYVFARDVDEPGTLWLYSDVLGAFSLTGRGTPARPLTDHPDLVQAYAESAARRFEKAA